MSTLKEKIAAADDIGKKLVHVPEWGVDVEMRTLTGYEMEQLDKESPDFRSQLIAASAFDPETGEKAFTSEDVAMLNGKCASATGRLIRAAFDLNGWTNEGRAELKKDSPPDGPGGSAS